MKTTILRLKNSVTRGPYQLALLLIPFALVYFGLAPQSRATCQDGCLTNDNTVLGDDALLNNTTGYDNSAVGFDALLSNTSGYENTATGALVLYSNTTGFDNTGIGYNSLDQNTVGIDNTATGAFALESNTFGGLNTATGAFALERNTNGIQNTATGWGVLGSNTAGSFNTAIGVQALSANTSGDNNIAVGYFAGRDLTTGSRNIHIGNYGVAGESNTIRLGRTGSQRATFIAGISGAIVPTGVAVIVDTTGHLGTTTSSARFKEEIKPMDKTSEAILALKPVTFRYKHELDPERIPQFGLVAEEVEKVNPDLVARDDQGKPYTVRYEAVNAMLLNEFLKEHRKVEWLEKTMAEQQKENAAMRGMLNGQAAQIQKVSAQLALSNAEPQTVLGNQ